VELAILVLEQMKLYHEDAQLLGVGEAAGQGTRSAKAQKKL
jgi:hypothetical protein